MNVDSVSEVTYRPKHNNNIHDQNVRSSGGLEVVFPIVIIYGHASPLGDKYMPAAIPILALYKV
jgi:hypothetical protein